MSLLLEARDLVGGYGGTDILNGVSLSLSREEIVVIVGPNGAGKSTAMKALFGLVTVRSGKVLLDGLDVTNAAPETLVKRGMAYVPQEANVFTTMTVEENLDMGAYTRRSGIQAAKDRVYDLLPRIEGQTPPARRGTFRWTASDGGDRSCAHGRSQALDAR